MLGPVSAYLCVPLRLCGKSLFTAEAQRNAEERRGKLTTLLKSAMSSHLRAAYLRCPAPSAGVVRAAQSH